MIRWKGVSQGQVSNVILRGRRRIRVEPFTRGMGRFPAEPQRAPSTSPCNRNRAPRHNIQPRSTLSASSRCSRFVG